MNSSSESDQLSSETRFFDGLKQGDKIQFGRVQFVIAIVLSLILMTIVHLVVPKLTMDSPIWVDSGDHILYISMAEGNIERIPFGSRVLVPLIARALSFIVSLELGFYVITFLSICAASIVIFLVLHELGFGFELALAGEVAFLSLGFTTKLFVFDFWLVDPFLIFCLMLSLFALARNDDRLFLISIILGVLTKETMLLMIPAYFFLNWRRNGSNREHIIKTTIFGSISVGLFFILRLMTPNTESFDLLGEIIYRTSIHVEVFLANPVNKLINLYIGMWGLFIVPLVIVAVLTKPRTFLIIAPLILLFYLQLTITGNGASNISRVLMTAAAPMILLQSFGAEKISRCGIPKFSFIIVGLSFFFLNTFNNLFDATAVWTPGRFYSMYASGIEFQVVLLLFWGCVFIIYIGILRLKGTRVIDTQVLA